MNKQEFLEKLEKSLRGLPPEDIAERIGFYNEIIEDKIEEGLTEEQAVATVGSPETIAAQILADTPLSRLAKEKIKSKKHKLGTVEIILLVLGSPIWLSLLLSAFAVALSVYVTLWALVAALWAVMVALVGAGIGVIIGGIIFAVTGTLLPGIACIGAGLFSVGIGIFAFFGCSTATQGTTVLTRKIAYAIKKSLIKEEVAE